MTDDRSDPLEPQGLLGTLLSPLRAPQRVITDIETIASALLSLQRDARDRLAAIDHHAGELVERVGALLEPVQSLDRHVAEMGSLEQTIIERMEALQAPLDRVDDRVTELQRLEQVITVRMDSIDEDLNKRMLAVEAEVHSMRAPIEQMARDVSQVVLLLPEPGDGPLTRLKDTFSASG